MEGRVCHVPDPGEPDDVWWFGFDCAHAWDYSRKMMADLRDSGMSMDAFGGVYEVYRTLDDVQRECAALAAQLVG